MSTKQDSTCIVKRSNERRGKREKRGEKKRKVASSDIVRYSPIRHTSSDFTGKRGDFSQE